jgi:hypothetical protein
VSLCVYVCLCVCVSLRVYVCVSVCDCERGILFSLVVSCFPVFMNVGRGHVMG